MNSRPFVGIMLSAVVLAGCAPKPAPAPPPPDAAAIRAALDKEIAKFGPVVQSKDAKGVAALFTADGVWILPDATTLTGSAAIEAGAKAFFDSFDTFTMESSGIDKLIVVSDSEAVTFAHGIGTMTMKGAKTGVKHNNPFADYWKKGADGTWRVAYEVNADGVVKP